MYRVSVNQETIEIKPTSEQIIDLISTSDQAYHAILDHTGYEVNIQHFDFLNKTAILNVNGNSYEVSIADTYDQMVASMGLLDVTEERINDVKAPIPGLIIEIPVTEGQEVKEGDALVVLSAMKMENILVAPNDGTVERIHVSLNEAVDKEKLLITLA